MGVGNESQRTWAGIDSHAHLAMEAFREDREEILARACQAGIAEILTASTTLADSPANVELASREGAPGIWASVGVHPHEAKTWKNGDEERLADLSRADRVVAIGETGLDYHYDFSPRETQRDVFARQVRLARRLNMPLIVHCREAAADVGSILEDEGAEECGGVLHCFTENEAFARRCLALGFYISFSGILTFRNSGPLREVAAAVPGEKLLVETDAPYLAPVPHRGRRNEPAHASLVLEALARIRGSEPAALSRTIRDNFKRLIARQ